MTIREIANLANTSRGTVDRVLNHRGNVAEDVRQRIEKVICETGYVAKNHLKKMERIALMKSLLFLQRKTIVPMMMFFMEGS